MLLDIMQEASVLEVNSIDIIVILRMMGTGLSDGEFSFPQCIKTNPKTKTKKKTTSSHRVKILELSCIVKHVLLDSGMDEHTASAIADS